MRAAVLRDPVASGVGQFAAIQAVAPSLQVELSPIDARDAREIERAVAAFATRPKAPREAAMAAFAKKLAVGISGAGQAEQATRQRWPPPAPRLRRLLRCHPAGWQPWPRWIVHKCYSGPWRPRRGGHPPRSGSPPKWTRGQDRERDPYKRSSGADQVRPSA